MLEDVIKSTHSVLKNDAADILATFAVKNVMNDLQVAVQIQMVDNCRAGVSRHDKDAMKVIFNTQADAAGFSKKLLADYGICSHTFGAGVAKTPQNRSIFLTKSDLDKMALVSKIVCEPGSGQCAYEIKSALFEESKLAASAHDKSDDLGRLQP